MRSVGGANEGLSRLLISVDETLGLQTILRYNLYPAASRWWGLLFKRVPNMVDYKTPLSTAHFSLLKIDITTGREVRA